MSGAALSLSLSLLLSVSGVALGAEVPEPELLYFALVDRFADGRRDRPGAVDRSDPAAWHGGDLAGVQQRLPHLEAMGVTRLWLSPIFTSRQEPFHSHGAFHGYWVEDLDGIEGRFGGRRALRRLARAAARADIDLVLDMVYNHVSFDSPMLRRHPDWFHDEPSIADWDDPEELVRGQVHGLPDLAQERPAVYAYLRDRSLQWATEAGAGGFRIDAVRHLPLDFLHQLSADLKEGLGEDFWLLGEDFQGDPVALSESFARGGFDAMFDFPLRYAMVDVFCRDRAPGRLAGVLSLDRLYSSPAGLVTFLDNHDLPRIASECGGERTRVEAALLFMFAQRGTPSITYGTEWLLAGAEEPANRGDVPWSAPPVLAETIQRLAALRAQQPLLRDPAPRHHRVTADGLLRSTHPDGLTVLVNHTDAPVEAPARATEWVSAGAGVEGLRSGDAVPPALAPGGVGVYFHPPVEQQVAVGEVVDVPLSVEAPPGAVAVRAVGAGPELGNWSPEVGVPLERGDGGRWQGTVRLPVGSVAEWKRVVQITGGSGWQWEDGENRYLNVEAMP